MKILVTVGNAFQPFDRLLGVVDSALATLAEPFEGVCQLGQCHTSPRGLRSIRRLGREEFDRAINEADVIICHGGVGALSTAIGRGHLPIALARRASLGEHVNDHQLDVVAQLALTGKVLDAENGIGAGLLAHARDSRKEPSPTSMAELETIASALRRAPRGTNAGRFSLRLLSRCTARVTRLR